MSLADRHEATVRHQISIEEGYSSEERDADERKLNNESIAFHRLISIAAA